jgi:hypothetical protein
MLPTCYSLFKVLVLLFAGPVYGPSQNHQVQVGLSGIEPETSPLSEARSNQLS